MRKMTVILTLAAVFAVMISTAFAGDEEVIWTDTYKIPLCEFQEAGGGLSVPVIAGFENGGAPGAPVLPAKVLKIAVPPNTKMKSLKLVVDAIETEELPGTYDIPPAPPCAADIHGEKTIISWGEAEKDIVDGKNMAIYGADAFFPAESAELLPYSQMRKWKFVRIVLNPVRYNPVTGKMVQARSISLSLTAQKGKIKDKSVKELKKFNKLLKDSKFDRRALKMFDNAAEAEAEYSTAAAASSELLSAQPAAASSETEDGGASIPAAGEGDFPPPAPGATYNYVIITTNAIESNLSKLSDFVSHLGTMGFSVLVVTEDDYGSLTGQSPNGTAEKIRQWLIDNYASYSIEYVLLIGNPDPTSGDVPMKMLHPYSPSGYPDSPSDYFYADLTGDWDLDADDYYGEYNGDRGVGGVDFAEEVYVGRIPLYSGNYSTVDGILQKIIDYDSVSSTPAWREKILLPMAVSNYGNEDNSGYTKVDGRNCPELVIDGYADPAGFSHYVFYEKAGLDPVPDSAAYDNASHTGISSAAVVAEWQNDYGCVFWWGHGSSTGVSRKYWNGDDGDGVPEGGEMTWTNFFSSSNCSSLDDSKPSIVYQSSCNNGWPENSGNLGYSLLKNGAVATVSSSRVSWYSIATWTHSSNADNTNIGFVFMENVIQDNDPVGVACFSAKNESDLSSNWWGGQTWMNRTDFNLYGAPHVVLAPVPDTTAPEAVSDLSHSTRTSVSVTLSWTAPGDDADIGTASSYDVRYSTSNINDGNWGSATQATGEPSPSPAGSTESFTVTGLTAGTTYYFAIKSDDEVPNTSALSNVYSVATEPPDSTAPAAVSDLAGTAATSDSIDLEFTAPGDDNSTGTAANYDIRYSTSTINDGNWAAATQATGEPAPSVAGSTENFTIDSLSAGTTYYFAMKASDEVPNTSSLSNVASYSTKALLTYSGTIFIESGDDDGSIDNSSPILINLSGDTFTGTNGDNFVTAGKVSTNIGTKAPGLTAVITRASDTQLSVTLTGNATSHGNASDIYDLAFTFDDSAFNGFTAATVENSTKSDLGINFLEIGTIVRYVNTASTAGGNGTTNSTTGDNRAYASLSEWQSSESTKDLVTAESTHTVICEGSSADTTAVVNVSGWTCDSTYYLTITASDSAATGRHEGKWDTGKYRLTPSSSSPALTISSAYTVVDGIQVGNTNDGGNSIQGSAANVTVSNCVVNGGSSGIYLTGSDCSVYNCVVQNSKMTLYTCGGIKVDGANGLIANNTVFGGGYYNSYRDAIYANLASTLVVNNISMNNEEDDYGGSGIQSYNISEDTTASGTGSMTSRSYATTDQGVGDYVIFTNLTPGSEDFHLIELDQTHNNAITAGDDLSSDFDTDIDGEPRAGDWDIGADQATSALASPTLTADSTDNDVDHSIVVTFTDDSDWRAAVTAVKWGVSTLDPGDYTLAAASLTIDQGVIQTAATQDVTIEADGYADAVVSQAVTAGAATQVVITNQPTAPVSNGGNLAQQPVVAIQDQYGNTVTTSSANVTAAKLDAGDWTLDGTSTVAASSGVATFSDLSATSAAAVSGAQLRFTSSGLTADDSDSFNIPAPSTTNWTAYHALFDNFTYNTDKVTGGCANSTPYTLKNYETEENLSATVTVTDIGTIARENRNADMNAASSTDGYDVFNGIITVPTTGNNVAYGTTGEGCTYTFENLDSAAKYTAVFYVSRGADYGNTRATLGDASAYVAAHSTGVGGGSDADVTDEDADYAADNSTNGYIFKWIDIEPSGDGGTSFTVDFTVQSGGYIYAPVCVMLAEQLEGSSAAISIADDGSITEGAENGEIITVTLSDSVFTDPITPGNWTVSNLPTGVSKGTVTRVGDTTVTIALSGNRTVDYDTNITDVTVECAAAETDAAEVLSDNTGVTLTATNDAESISIADDGDITEGSEDGEIITVTLTGGSFADPITPANWTISNQPAGVSKGTVTRVGDTTVTIALSGNASGDYDTDITDFTVQCTAAEVDDCDSALSDNTGVTFTATVEAVPEISIDDDGDITEGSEDGEIITVTLSDAVFAGSLTPGNWTVTNLPAGVSKGTVTRVGDTTATIALSGDRTSDYDSDITSVTVECTAAETNAGESLSDNTGVTLTARNEVVSYSGTSFTEAPADDGSISNSLTLTLSGDTFAADVVSGAHVSASNVPAGLSASFVRNSGTEIAFSLTGNASSHANSDDISNLTVSFDDSAFDGGPVSYVTGANRGDLNVDFTEPESFDWYVSTTGNDTTGDGSSGNPYATIGKAITEASAGQSILVEAGTYTEAGIAVNKGVGIYGEGAGSTIVQAHASQGSASDRVFNVTGSGDVVISDMTVRHGNVTGNGGAVYYLPTANGTLTVEYCVISDNDASGNGGGICAWSPGAGLSTEIVVVDSTFDGNTANVNGDYTGHGGGGMFVGREATTPSGAVACAVTGCTFVGNAATYNQGGGMMIRAAGANCVVENSTFNGNTANATTYGMGGGICSTYDDSFPPAVYNCTIAGNSCGRNDSAKTGGGIRLYNSDMTIHNTIVADNQSITSGGCPDLSAQYAAYSGNYNLVETPDGVTVTGTGNVTGSDPGLAALADNGGPTDTMVPSAAAALRVIPRGSEPYYNDSPAEDQRGYWIDRPTDNADYLSRTIGAYWAAAGPTPARGFRGWLSTVHR